MAGSWPTVISRSPLINRAAIKSAAARILCAIGAPAIALRRWRPGQLVILMYHGVEADRLSPRCDYVHDSASLRRELGYIRKHFNVLPLDEALERLRAGTLPDRAAALTFDDGTANLAVHAAPVLRDLGLPAAVFLATGPMGTDETLWPDRLWLAFARTDMPEVDLQSAGLETYPLRSAEDRGRACDAVVQHFKTLPDAERIAKTESLVASLGLPADADAGPFRLLTWDDARSLAEDGLVSLFPHTVTHPILSNCPDWKVDFEISESCSVLERETGRAPAVFAYPNGGVDDFDERAVAVLRRLGIGWALSTINGIADQDSDPFALPRIGIGGNDSFARFKLRVSGFSLPKHRPAAAIVLPVWAESATEHLAVIGF